MEPRKTAGMLNFERQLDEAFPDRKVPDGWIGDTAHRARTSSHNPDDTPGSKPEWDGDADGVSDVRAVDVSSDLGQGVSSRGVCDHMARLPGLDRVVRYFIHQGLIWHERNEFRPVPHDGDPHPTHIHVTFAFSEAADDNTSFNYRFEEVAVPLTDDDVDKVWSADVDTSPNGYSARGALFTSLQRTGSLANTQVPALAQKVTDLEAKVDQIITLLSSPPAP